jgi:phosphoglucosamine mutase
MRKYFGTDGIRGKVGVHPISPDFAMKLGWAAGRVLARNGNGPVLIGKDTRLSGYMFESALESGLSAAGVDVLLIGPMPTPGIAFLTINTRSQAGIVISASHNPYSDNGFKFFSGNGFKLDDKIELEIETQLEKPIQVVDSARLGKARRINDAQRRYIEFCKSKQDNHVNMGGVHIVLDCAHGAAYNIAPYVFEELGAKVESIGVSPNGLNINEGCGTIDINTLKNSVLEKGADLGIALDGDGDRLILVDNTGEVVDGDEILYIIAKSNRDALNGSIVGTLMSNLGLEHAIQGMGLGFLRARVGDRYVMDVIMENKLVLGGESSGHIINLDKATTGDGIISAIQVLEAILSSGLSLHEIKGGMAKYPQTLINIRINADQDIQENPAIDALVKEAESQLGNDGRILLRQSGTEPLLRVMVEGRDDVQVNNLARELATEVENVLHA